MILAKMAFAAKTLSKPHSLGGQDRVQLHRKLSYSIYDSSLIIDGILFDKDLAISLHARDRLLRLVAGNSIQNLAQRGFGVGI